MAFDGKKTVWPKALNIIGLKYSEKNLENLASVQFWNNFSQPNSQPNSNELWPIKRICAHHWNGPIEIHDKVSASMKSPMENFRHGKPLNCMAKTYCSNTILCDWMTLDIATHTHTLSDSLSPVNTFIAKKKGFFLLLLLDRRFSSVDRSEGLTFFFIHFYCRNLFSNDREWDVPFVRWCHQHISTQLGNFAGADKIGVRLCHIHR